VTTLAGLTTDPLSDIDSLKQRVSDLEAQLRRTASGDLAADSITSTLIADNSITSSMIQNATIQGLDIATATIAAGNIVSGTITATQIANATITGTQIASATILGTHIQDATITASDIANTTITALQIANATITGGKIASATITGGNIGSATVTGGNIAATTITAGNIANNTITAAQISALTITSSEISDLTITGAKIASSTITASKLSVTQLSAITADLGSITAGTVTGATLRTATSGARVIMDTAGIRAYNASDVAQLDFSTATGNLTITGTLTTNSAVPASTITGQITAAQFGGIIGGGNMLTNSSFENPTTPLAGWGLYNNNLAPAAALDTLSLSSAKHGAKVARLTNSTDTTGDMGVAQSNDSGPLIEVGKKYTLSAYGKTASGTASFLVHINWLDSGNSVVGGGNAATPVTANSTSWTRVSVTGTAPATATEAKCYAIYNNPTNGQVCYVDAMQLEEGDVPTAYAPRPDEILPNAVGSTELVDNAVTAAKLADLAVDQAALQDAIVSNAKIVDTTIQAAKIALDTITASQIANNAITSNELNTDAVTNAKIADNAVTNAEIANLAVTGAKIAANTVTAANIAAGTITANEIAANTITANKLLITVGGGNVLPNSSAERPDGAVTPWGASYGTLVTDTGTVPALHGTDVFKHTSDGTNGPLLSSPVVLTNMIQTGDLFAASGWVRPTIAGVSFRAEMRFHNAGLTGFTDVVGANVSCPANVWTRVTVTGAVPASPNNNQMQAQFRQSATPANGTVTYFDALQLERGDVVTAYNPMADEIMPGTIVASMIAANTITAAQIAANTLTANEINANAITSSELAANAVIAGKIAALTIVAGDIAANTITAAKIAADTLTATEIAANAITTSEIAANTIQAGDIAADTITANEIAANAITVSELNADAVTSAKIAANTIVAADIAAGTITSTEIAANTITAGDIAAGTITATEIAAGAITATKLSVKFGISNVLINAAFVNWPSGDTPQNFAHYDNGGTGTHTWSKVAGGGPFGRNSWRLQSTAKTAAKGFMSAQQYDWLPNKTYVVSFYWKGDSQPTWATNASIPTDLTITGIDMPTASTTVWQRYSWRLVRTATTGIAGGDDKDFIYVQIVNTTADVQIAMMQFEEGEYPSAWTPKIDEVLPDTITSTEIAPGTITTNEIAATTILAGNIAAGTITGTQIAATTIAAGNIVTDTLTASQIATNAITTTEIAANTITAGDIAAHTITATEIAAATITATEIAAGTITASRIAVSNISDNLIANGSAEGASTDSWALVEGGPLALTTVLDSTAPSGDYAFRIPSGTNAGEGYRAIAVKPGVTYSVRLFLKHSNGNGTYYVRLNEKSTYPTGDYVTSALRTSFTDLASALNNSTITTWTLQEYTYTVPAGIYWVSPSVYNWGPSTGTLDYDAIEIREQINAVSISDGTITANKLNVANMFADVGNVINLTAGLITGTTIQTNTTGARVVLDTSGLTAYNASDAPTVVIPVTGAASFSGAIDAVGGLTQDAVTASPASTARKHAWLDSSESEIGAVYGATSAYPGTSTSRLMASATAPMSYSTLVKAHANLKHFWRLNGGGSISADSVSSGALALSAVDLPAAATGLIAGTDGAIKQSTTGGMQYSATPALNENVTNGLSLEYWVKFEALPDVDTKLMLRSSAVNGSQPEYWKSTYKTSTAKLEFSILIGGVAKTITGGTTIVANTTYHVVHTYDGANLKTYLNGVSDATAVAQTGNIDAQNITPYKVGKVQTSGSTALGKLPTTTGQGGFGGGAPPGAWTNAANIVSSNDTYATATSTNGGTEYIYGGGLGFALPTGAVITAYTFDIEMHSSNSGAFFDIDTFVRPTYNSTTGQLSHTYNSYQFSAADLNYNLSSSAATYGTLTPAQINDANFGFAVRFKGVNGIVLSVDRISLTVTYHIPITMDEAAVYNAALTSTVVADHYQTGTTGISTSTATVEKQVIGADGTSDFMRLDIGDLKITARSTAPSLWLMCNGAAVSRTTYAALFTAIGTTYGTGDGSTTFNVPDLRGRVPIAPDGGVGRVTANNALGNSSGSQAHTHDFTHTHTLSGTTGGASAGGGAGGSQFRFGDGFQDVHNHGVLGNTASQSTATTSSVNSLPPYQVVNYMIYAGV